MRDILGKIFSTVWSKVAPRDPHLSAIIDAIPGCVSWFDRSGNYLGVNQNLADCHSMSVSDFRGKQVGFLKEESKPGLKETLFDFFASDEKTRRVEMDVVRKGVEHTYFLYFQKYENSQCAVVVGIDVTDKLRLEDRANKDREAAINAAQLSALGEMAGGIAHEINNPLAVIQASSRKIARMLRDKDVDPQCVTLLGTIETTVLRIGKIVRAMRSFARDGRNDPMTKASLAVILEDALTLCSERLKKHSIQLEMPQISEDISIKCRQVQIGQVIINLLNNAFDAIENLPQKWIRVTFEETEDNFVISVVDSGNGIPAELVSQIMNPFFTTKAVGTGTGLGLSIAKSIAEDHGGNLTYKLVEGHTCMCLEIPKVQRNAVRQIVA